MEVWSFIVWIFGCIKYKVTELQHKNKFLVDIYTYYQTE